MSKKVQFFIDDFIWLFRDLTREKPVSLFDNSFMAMLKRAHDKYGMKVQLNTFYRTSFWYGDDEFSLSEMTEDYKKEWESSSDWLKIGFHSKEEWPDYPYVNANYSLVNDNFNLIKSNVVRFAGEKTFALSVVPHWAPISREGIQALYDNGIRVTYATYGVKEEYMGEEPLLFYGHEARILHNRKVETGVYNKVFRGEPIERSLCAYNHISEEEANANIGKLSTIKDKETGMRYTLAAQVVINAVPLDELEEELSKYVNQEYLSIGNHEQYFYSDYYAYQPDYAEKIYTMCKVMKDNGFEFIFAEDLPL